MALVLAVLPLAITPARADPLSCAGAQRVISITPPKVIRGIMAGDTRRGRTDAIQFSGRIWAEGHYKQSVDVTCLRVVGWHDPGWSYAGVHNAMLILNIRVGDGKSSASFGLYRAGSTIPAAVPADDRDLIAPKVDIRPSQRPGMVINLGAWPKDRALLFAASGNQFSSAGQTNSYSVDV